MGDVHRVHRDGEVSIAAGETDSDTQLQFTLSHLAIRQPWVRIDRLATINGARYALTDAEHVAESTSRMPSGWRWGRSVEKRCEALLTFDSTEAPTPPVAVRVRPTRTFVRSPANTRSIPPATTNLDRQSRSPTMASTPPSKLRWHVIGKAWTSWSPFGFGS
jgi:hypothetical protein